MVEVYAFNRVNRPFFLIGSNGSRVEFPAFDYGGGDLVGSQLRRYLGLVKTNTLTEGGGVGIFAVTVGGQAISTAGQALAATLKA